MNLQFYNDTAVTLPDSDAELDYRKIFVTCLRRIGKLQHFDQKVHNDTVVLRYMKITTGIDMLHNLQYLGLVILTGVYISELLSWNPWAISLLIYTPMYLYFTCLLISKRIFCNWYLFFELTLNAFTIPIILVFTNSDNIPLV